MYIYIHIYTHTHTHTHTHIYIYIPSHSLMCRVFTNGPEDRVQSQVESYQRLRKMVLDVVLLNTKHYKVRIKGKVEQSRGWSSPLLYTSVY